MPRSVEGQRLIDAVKETCPMEERIIGRVSRLVNLGERLGYKNIQCLRDTLRTHFFPAGFGSELESPGKIVNGIEAAYHYAQATAPTKLGVDERLCLGMLRADQLKALFYCAHEQKYAEAVKGLTAFGDPKQLPQGEELQKKLLWKTVKAMEECEEIGQENALNAPCRLSLAETLSHWKILETQFYQEEESINLICAGVFYNQARKAEELDKNFAVEAYLDGRALEFEIFGEDLFFFALNKEGVKPEDELTEKEINDCLRGMSESLGKTKDRPEYLVGFLNRFMPRMARLKGVEVKEAVGEVMEKLENPPEDWGLPKWEA